MSTTATLALKACPFCGDTDTRVFGESAPEWWVTCMGCRASSPCRTTRPQAIAGWNRRAALAQRTEQRTDPWRQAVDEALIAHALDCTGPGDDPKEKVKELIEWAVTIATDPRVSEQAVTAAREQEASKPFLWVRPDPDYRGNWEQGPFEYSHTPKDGMFWKPLFERNFAKASATGAEPAKVYLVCTGEVYEGQETYTRHDRAPQMCDFETLYATPTTSTTGKVDVSRVRDEALEEAVGLYESEDVLAPVGNSAWGEAYQEGWIAGAQAYREAIRSLIGTPKSAEGEGA
jgi:hypothetical protein